MDFGWRFVPALAANCQPKLVKAKVPFLHKAQIRWSAEADHRRQAHRQWQDSGVDRNRLFGLSRDVQPSRKSRG
jgi:hypothetical protein